MKLTLAAIGLLKGPELELASDYEKRIASISRLAGITGLTVKDWPESRRKTPEQRRTEEAQKLMSVCGSSVRVVLDERGKSLSSEAFAKWIAKEAERGSKQVSFLIGGPDGHCEDLRQEADLLLSLGPMTFPHRLVRVMLLEQIYRSVTILVSHPYHRA